MESYWDYTDSRLMKEFPEAWGDGYTQGLNPNCGTRQRPYVNPYQPNTPPCWAWRVGCWWGFVKSDSEG